MSSSTDNYRIGGGRLFFNQKKDGVYQGLRDLGNAPGFDVETEVETKPHYSTSSGAKTKDKSATILIDPTATITLDEINADNLSLMFMADMTKYTQVAEEGLTATIVATQGIYFELGYMFIDSDSDNITVTSNSGATTYTYTTDYSIEDKSGKILIVEGGSITNDTEIEVTFNTLDQVYYELSAFTENTIEGELHFVSNTTVGKNQIIKMWSVSMTPSSAVTFISDDYNDLELKCEIQNCKTEHPLFPFMQFFTE
jgi:hypothetical protein